MISTTLLSNLEDFTEDKTLAYLPIASTKKNTFVKPTKRPFYDLFYFIDVKKAKSFFAKITELDFGEAIMSAEIEFIGRGLKAYNSKNGDVYVLTVKQYLMALQQLLESRSPYALQASIEEINATMHTPMSTNTWSYGLVGYIFSSHFTRLLAELTTKEKLAQNEYPFNRPSEVIQHMRKVILTIKEA